MTKHMSLSQMSVAVYIAMRPAPVQMHLLLKGMGDDVQIGLIHVKPKTLNN